MRIPPLLLIAGIASSGAAYAAEPNAATAAGSVALLVGHASEPATIERWTAALQDSDARVRGAAARAINVSGGVVLVDSLKRALAAESDQDAANEEMLALAALGGKEADELVLAAGQRFGKSGVSEAATALARARGPEALSSLPALRKAGLADYDTFCLWSTRGGTQGLTAAGSIALRDRDPAEWKAVLETALRPGASLDRGVVLAALADTNEEIRASTFWHLALVRAHGANLDGRVAAAVTAALDAERPKDVAVALTLELLGRTLGRKPTEQQAWIAALADQKARAPYAFRLSREKALRAKLEPREIEALSAATRGDPLVLGKSLRREWPPSDTTETAPRVRTPNSLPRGFVAGVLAATRCDPRTAHGVAVAQIAYGPDGRPNKVSLRAGPRGPLGRPPACEEAARVLLASDLAMDFTGPEEETVLVILESDPLTCLAEEPPPVKAVGGSSEEKTGNEEPRSTSSIPKPPRKIKDTRPTYPENARRQRIQGSVALEAILSPTGCVQRLQLLRGIPELNWEAISTVSQWKYAPATLDGVPIPMIMTVTVNFHLQ